MITVLPMQGKKLDPPERGVEWVYYGEWSKKIPDAKERAEALCRELNEKARGE